MADGFVVTRRFDAPRERVWREWTEPEAFSDWFGGAEADIPLESVAMEVRPGGAWRATMYAGADRREIRWWGEYHEVDAPARLVFTICDREDGVAELVTVELADIGDGRTEMRVEQRGGMTPEDYERAKSGWGGFFDRMGERLADD
jgi:uncharacterized protein YndB with AHSA1/START domain